MLCTLRRLVRTPIRALQLVFLLLLAVPLLYLAQFRLYNHYKRPLHPIDSNERPRPRMGEWVQSACQVPRLDPWDPSIRQYLEPPSRMPCVAVQPDLLQLVQGRFQFNDAWLINGSASDGLQAKPNCIFRCFGKQDGSDHQLAYGQYSPLSNGTQPGCEFSEVQCSQPTYWSVFNQILPVLNNATDGTDDEKPPDVLLFVIDSVSASHWRRSLPKLYRVLTEEYGSFVFRGFTKVGENSFPNGLAFLAGESHGSPRGRFPCWSSGSVNYSSPFRNLFSWL
jgi:Protein of unknown function (DUF229)